MAKLSGACVSGPVPQGDFLATLGIAERAAALAKAQPERDPEIAEAVRRLTSPAEMGTMFRAMALTSPEWPEPSGF